MGVKLLVFIWLSGMLLGGPDVSRILTSIQDLIQQGDLAAASELAESELRKHPQDGGLLNLQGVIHARRNELPAARADFQAATRSAPALTPAWQNLGRACLQLNDAACSGNAWRHVLVARPRDPEAHGSLALLYQKESKFAESLRELDSGNVDNPPLRCTNLVALGRVNEAKSAAAAWGKRTETSEADVAELIAQWDAPRFAGVVAALLEALDARGMAAPGTLRRLIIAYEQLGETQKARVILERVAQAEPNNAVHLLELARLAEEAKDYEGALGYLAHARDLEPANPRIHFLFGLIAGEMNLPIEAKQSLDKAMAIHPDNPDYSFAMGSVILKTRDAAMAASYFETYVQAKPDDARGHYALGLAYFAGGDYTKAKQQMLIVDTNKSFSGSAEYYLGRMARLDGDTGEALQHLNKSIKLLPQYSENHTELARIALLAGNMRQAQSELERALQLAPDSFQANQQLLVLYQRTHDSRAASQAETLKKLDEERSRRAELMLRTIEVRP